MVLKASDVIRYTMTGLFPVFVCATTVPDSSVAQQAGQGTSRKYKNLTPGQISGLEQNFAAEFLILDYGTVVDDTVTLPQDWVHQDRYDFLEKKYASRKIVVSFACESIEAAAKILDGFTKERFGQNKSAYISMIFKHIPDKGVTYPGSSRINHEGIEADRNFKISSYSEVSNLMREVFENALEFYDDQISKGKSVQFSNTSPNRRKAVEGHCYLS